MLGLLAFSLLFTAGGAIVTPLLGAAALPLGMVGSIVTLLVLIVARSLAAPVRLGLFSLLSALEGLTLGVILNSYLAAGLGNVVVLAGGATGGLTLVLSADAWTTKRDLSGPGSYLFMGCSA